MQILDLTRRNFSPPKFDIYDYVQIRLHISSEINL